MDRPRVICHMLMSLDGKIDGRYFSLPETRPGLRKYGELRTFYGCPATIYGTTTAAEGYADGYVYVSDLPERSAEPISHVYVGESGAESYSGNTNGSFKVTINKASATVTAPTANGGLVYNGGEQELVKGGSVSGVAGCGQVQYSLTNGSDYGNAIPKGKDAKEYTVYWKVTPTDTTNFTYNVATSGDFTVTIDKAAATVTPPEAKALTYNGSEMELITAGSVTSGVPGCGEMLYSLTDKNDYSNTIPKGKGAGTYTVYWKVTTSENYDCGGKTNGQVSVTINKTDSNITAGNVTATYGDDITLTATVKGSDVQGISLMSLPTADKVRFSFPKGGSIEADVTYDDLDRKDSGTATVTISAAEVKKYLEPGNNTVTVSYGGSINLNEKVSVTMTVTVNERTLTYDVTATDRVYVKGNKEVAVALTPNNLVDGANDEVTLTAKGTVSSADAKTYSSIELSEITMSGDDAKYYTVENSATSATSVTIEQKEVTLTWAGGEDFTFGYDGQPHGVTVTVNTGFDETLTAELSNETNTNAGTYTATATMLVDDTGDADNYKLPDNVTQEYTIKPAEVSFVIGKEVKAGWSGDETNEDPNPDGYKLSGEGTAYALSMTYDSYKHKASVSQTESEAVEILPAGVNGFTVTYKKAGTGDDITEVRDAGTYDIMVNLTPAEGDIYNYAFVGQDARVHSLKIGEITVEPYTVHVTWSHLRYVYHAHQMHPNVRVQNAFKADVQPNDVPVDFEPAKGYSGELLAFAETSGADVGNYDVEVELYGTSAGNYVVDDNTETVTIVPAPVTFTVGDNVWEIDEGGALSRDTVTLRPTWGAVSTTPDVAVHHSYPLAGTKITEDLGTEIVYKKDGEEVTAPSEAGKYEVWVKIGNKNYRHSATETGELHHVGELVITDDPDSIRTYTVTFDPGYEGAPKGPAAIEKAFPNQTVVLPPVSGENEDGTTYDLTREGYSFLGWSYNGHTYQPNEELHMPYADVTFKGEWIEAVPIGGKVVQESSGGEPTPVNGATVVLKQGSEPAAEAVTGSDGTFDFGLVTPGIYNLEVTYENGGGAKIVKTFLVEVGESGSVDNEFVLPDTALNTVVEVAPGIKSAVSMDGMITDEAAAEVYTEDDKETVKNGGTVEFKMSISETTLTGPQEEEIPVPDERISMVLDMKLTKTVTSSSGTNTTEITDSKIPVTTVIHLPAEIQGKSGYTVYRFHDEDGDGSADMRAITTSKNENGEYLQVVREGTAIELHAEFYSTYVLTWYQSSGGGATAYPVTLPENALNGTVTSNYEKAVKNSIVTLTVTPDEGHMLEELTVTDSDGNAIALTDNGDGTYSFMMPDGGVTVKVVFKCEGGEACQSRKFTDLDVKAWYHDYTDYVIGCGLMHGVDGNLFDPNGAVTRAQMVTVLWNMSGDPVVNYYMTYSDVSESAWYAEAIRWATSEGVVDGYGNGKFGPNDPITREQMATMLYRYEQKYGDGGFTGEWMYRLPFTDLDQISDWAFEAVAWCNMKGIITGKDGNRVDPKGSAKRCEMAAVLTRYRYENDTENDTE